MKKLLILLAFFALGLVCANKSHAQVSYNWGIVDIKGDDGDNRVFISALSGGGLKVSLRKGDGTIETKEFRYTVNRIRCDLGKGTNYYSNRSSVQDKINVYGSGNNVIYCGDGYSYVSSYSTGNDFILGGGGNDVIWGGEGYDWLLGEEGDDFLSESVWKIYFAGYYPSDGQTDFLMGGTGNDRFLAGDEDRVWQ